MHEPHITNAMQLHEYKLITPPIPDSNKAQRIHSLDALRAFTLLGILLVHTSNLFGNDDIIYSSTVDSFFRDIIQLLLAGRCSTIFTFLFGCSFWLILRKPNYPTNKFIWRCILLMLIGICAKIFYTYDALLWYGIWGVVLCLFRKMKDIYILLICAILYFLSCYLSKLGLGDLVFGINGNIRYSNSSTILSVINYPVWEAIKDYLRVVVNNGIFGTLWKMLLGYWFAKQGYLFELKKLSNKKFVLLSLILYFISFFVMKSVLFRLDLKFLIPYTRSLGILFGAIFYTTLFLKVYYKYSSKLSFMEPYGKLGLTNYFFQGIIGVISLYVIFLPNHFDFIYYFVFMLFIYIVQIIFSNLWLRNHKYGPLEGLWRKATDLYPINN